MKKLDEYFKIKEEIHKHFGYTEDWCVIPLSDYTEYFWYLEQDSRGSGDVHFADTETELENQDGQYYVESIYTQRFLPKWVYRAEDYTMVVVDTQVDGNKFLAIFDNAKERNNLKYIE